MPDPGIPPWWVIETLYATVWVAREQIEAGQLASSDAPPWYIARG